MPLTLKRIVITILMTAALKIFYDKKKDKMNY